MKLNEGLYGRSYQIKTLKGNAETNNRLEAVGVCLGTLITILHRKKSGSMVIWVRCTRLALGREITREIEIREAL